MYPTGWRRTKILLSDPECWDAREVWKIQEMKHRDENLLYCIYLEGYCNAK